MKYGIPEALVALRPGAAWLLRNSNDYSTLDWQSTDSTAPTLEEIENKIIELDTAEPMRLLREERDKRLQACDWWALVDQTLTPERSAYRQALRDITVNATPQLNEIYKLDLNSINWPTNPE